MTLSLSPVVMACKPNKKKYVRDIIGVFPGKGRKNKTRAAATLIVSHSFLASTYKQSSTRRLQPPLLDVLSFKARRINAGTWKCSNYSCIALGKRHETNCEKSICISFFMFGSACSLFLGVGMSSENLKASKMEFYKWYMHRDNTMQRRSNDFSNVIRDDRSNTTNQFSFD